MPIQEPPVFFRQLPVLPQQILLQFDVEHLAFCRDDDLHRFLTFPFPPLLSPEFRIQDCRSSGF